MTGHRTCVAPTSQTAEIQQEGDKVLSPRSVPFAGDWENWRVDVHAASPPAEPDNQRKIKRLAAIDLITSFIVRFPAIQDYENTVLRPSAPKFRRSLFSEER